MPFITSVLAVPFITTVLAVPFITTVLAVLFITSVLTVPFITSVLAVPFITFVLAVPFLTSVPAFSFITSVLAVQVQVTLQYPWQKGLNHYLINNVQDIVVFFLGLKLQVFNSDISYTFSCSRNAQVTFVEKLQMKIFRF